MRREAMLPQNTTWPLITEPHFQKGPCSLEGRSNNRLPHLRKTCISLLPRFQIRLVGFLWGCQIVRATFCAAPHVINL